MPAYFESGFCVRQPSWHGQETLLDDYPADWSEARRLAGLTWEPRLVPMYRASEHAPITTPDGDLILTPTAYEQVPGMQLVERDDTGAVLGPVSDQFGLITHAEMGEIVETILGETNVKYETAGSVKGGATVWVLVRLDEPYTNPGDIGPDGQPVATYPFLALLNSHNGAGACKVTYTQVRVVCWNTVQAADADGNRHGRQFSFRHVGKPMERIEEARAALNGVREDASRWQAMAEELYGMPVDQAFTARFLSEFIPEPPAGVTSNRVRANIARDRQHFMALLESETNAHLADRGLGLFNASVEFLDHVRGFRNADTYLGRTILRAEPMKARALTMIREMAAAN